MLHVLSLGAGVQSTTLALMAAVGDLPLPDCAIFADTRSEPAAVYRHLDWLDRQLPFPVYRVTAGSLRDHIVGAMTGAPGRQMHSRPPFFTGGGGMLRRECTEDYKVIPIQRKLRELLGMPRRSPGPRQVVATMWIGISRDEATRMKPSRLRWLAHAFPLVDRNLTRSACLAWCAANGYPVPPKSACSFCPFHSDAVWRAMKRDDPVAFAEAVALDAVIRPGMPGPRRPDGEAWYVHPARVPLDQSDFSTLEDHGQLNLFENECEGMCGV